MQESNIAWTDQTWNPTHGCSKASAGCDNCYAETLFISFEPLIGPVGDIDLAGYDWAIVGGESGPDDVRREMDHEWARDILEQCREYDVAFFFKQSSARQPERGQRLTVKNEKFGIYEQRKIRELPDLPEPTIRARKARADGGDRCVYTESEHSRGDEP